ncbi:aspartic peptidase domain-containing protein [Sparassis latifolia]
MLAGLAFLSLSSLLAMGHALKFSVQRRAAGHSDTVVVTNPANANNVGFSDAWQAYGLYTITVYVQGQPFQVQLDTGSSDLWIDTSNVTIDGFIDTGYSSTDIYADSTESSGPIVMANVSVGEFLVEGQAMINAIDSNATAAGADVGLLGIGPPLASQIFWQLLNSSYSGMPFLNNVFNYHPDEQAFITLLLTRSNIGITEGGVFSISELVVDYASILDTPQLPVHSDTDFLTFMDGIYVNGEFLTGHSMGVNGTSANAIPNENQTLVVLDSGTTLIPAPQYYVDAIYGNIPGANFSSTMNTYEVPCSTKLNISMLFGDILVPIDPIDATMVNVTDDGSVQCFGTFTYMFDGTPLDFLLGDTFLRNVYSLFYYGNWTAASVGTAPYMQVLPLTDPDAAWANFDALNLQRIGQLEWQQMQANANSTSSYTEAASMSVTYSLAPPSAVRTSISFVPSSVPSMSVFPSSATPSSSPSSPFSNSPSSPSSNSPSSNSANSSPATPSSTPGSTVRLNADLASSLGDSSSVNLSGLTRNSYIIMGLIGGVLVLLIGVLIKLVKNSRNQQYRAVPNIIRPPMHFNDKPYELESEDLMTPYDDPTRR